MTTLFDPEIAPADLNGRRVTILGLGRGRTTSGLAAYLVGQGAHVTVTDTRRRDERAEGIARLGATPVEYVFAPSSDDEALARADLVFVGPGQRPRSPTVLRATQMGVPVLTEMGLFFRLCPAPIVGITGTKGKSTTTTLVGEMLRALPRRVLVGGNLGTAVIQELPSLDPADLVVLELSSFQLETLARSPHVAVVTNVYEDHLDHHGTRDAYIAAKRNILAWQGPRDVAVLNLDDPTTVALHTGAASAVRGYSLSLRPREGGYLDDRARLVLVDGDQQKEVVRADELGIPGRHNIGNALAAAIVARYFGVEDAEIARVLRSFSGLPHRLETVAEQNGVLFVNDSQATTPVATLAALDAFARPAVLILGGHAKGTDFGPLGRAVAARARGAVLIGTAADEIASAIGSGLPVERAKTLEEAVAKARAMAKPGDVVLLSPACASFDMFRSYEERGDLFRKIVLR